LIIEGFDKTSSRHLKTSAGFLLRTRLIEVATKTSIWRREVSTSSDMHRFEKSCERERSNSSERRRNVLICSASGVGALGSLKFWTFWVAKRNGETRLNWNSSKPSQNFKPWTKNCDKCQKSVTRNVKEDNHSKLKEEKCLVMIFQCVYREFE
jgi:hypothetical protein